MKTRITESAYWSRAGSLAGIDTLAISLGQDIRPLLKRFGFADEVLSDPELRIPYGAFAQLLEACADEWDCPEFGLLLGQTQHLSVLGPISLVARLSATLGGALAALLDHATIHSTGYDLLLSSPAGSDAGRVAVIYRPKPGSGAGRQILMLSMAIVRNVLATLIGNPAFRPSLVTFSCAKPARTDAARPYFACPMDFDKIETMLYFEARLLRQPTAIRDTAYAPLINAYCDQIGRQFAADVIEATRRLIGQLIPTGRCSCEVVADCLQLQPRTLQRRLKAQGTTFSKLLDSYRKEMALELVGRKTVPLVQIAQALGFADQSVFNQAFRRWTGTTPRRLLKNPDAQQDAASR